MQRFELKFVKIQTFCFNCLVSGHTVQGVKMSCVFEASPFFASQVYHTTHVQSEVTSLQATMSDVHLGHVSNNDQIVLATAIVNVW